MRKVIRANGKCPLCGCEANILFVTTECTNIECSNHKDGILTKAEYDCMDSNPVEEAEEYSEEKETLFDDVECDDDCDECDCDDCDEDDERKD